MQTISPAYRSQNRALHETRPDYGSGGGRWAPLVGEIMRMQDCETVLDFGCGKGGLKDRLGNFVSEYDPAIPGKDGDPSPADLVVSTDVLEHVEPEYLEAFLSRLASLSNKAAFVVIATRPAKKTLPDGRNAHLIVKGDGWWRRKLQRWFVVVSERIDPAGVSFLLFPKSRFS